MKKFKVIVTRTEEYEVDIDENIFDEKAREEFNRDFYEIKDLTGHVKNIIKQFSEEPRYFIEGYGTISVDNECESSSGFNINYGEKDVEYEIDVKEIK